HLANEIIQHRFGDFEVADDAVLERTDRADAAGRFAQHLFGRPAHRIAVIEHTIGAALDSDDRRLVEHDALAAHTDQGVAGPQVDTHIDTEPAKKMIEKHRGQLPRKSVAIWASLTKQADCSIVKLPIKG